MKVWVVSDVYGRENHVVAVFGTRERAIHGAFGHGRRFYESDDGSMTSHGNASDQRLVEVFVVLS